MLVCSRILKIKFVSVAVRAVVSVLLSRRSASSLCVAKEAYDSHCFQNPCKMLSRLLLLLLGNLFAHATVLPRSDPPFQSVPVKATTPDNHFNISGVPLLTAQPPVTSDTTNPVYGPRSICSTPSSLFIHSSNQILPTRSTSPSPS
jgi:hypothetical protein